jgi:hypothetical protein
MNSFQSYIAKTNTFKYLQRKSDRYGFDSTELHGNKIHQLLNAMTNENICVSNMNVDMRKAFWAGGTKLKHYTECLDWGVFEQRDDIWTPFSYDIDEFINDYLNSSIKTHYTFVSMENYNEKGSVHEGVLIIHNRQAYYINSHGKWTPKNQNGKEYKKSIDFIFLRQLFRYINKNLPQNKQITFTEKNFYLGACLQECDNYGLCYIFPVTMWYMLNNEYKLATDLLFHNGAHAFVYWCFKDFNPLMKKESNKCLKNGRFQRCKLNDDQIQASLVKNVYFMKKVLNTTVSYLTQKKLLEKYNISY